VREPKVDDLVIYRTPLAPDVFARITMVWENGYVDLDLGPYGEARAVLYGTADVKGRSSWRFPAMDKFADLKKPKKPTHLQIEEWFTYHPLKGPQVAQYELIREAAKALAYTLNVCCPESADKSAAMRKLRECVMTANASIALGPFKDLDSGVV